MREYVAMAFGFLVLLTAAGLAGWELYQHARTSEEFRWLHTSSRLRRRIAMAILLLFVSALILGEAFGWLSLTNVRHLLTYVVMLTGLALTLMVLSVRDLAETARNAERHAMEDLHRAIDEQKRRAESPGER